MYASFNARALGIALDADASIELAASAGFAGVDLLVRDIIERGDDVARLRHKMDALQIRGGAWPLPVDWRSDRERFTRDLRALPRYAEAAARLGLTRTGTWIMPETPGPPPSTDARAGHLAEIAELHLTRLGAIARVLADHGTRLGLEVIGVESSRTGQGIPFAHRLKDAWPYVDRLRESVPGTGVLVDAFHLYAADECFSVALARGAGAVVWVHVADLPRNAPADRRLIRDGDRGLPGENGAVDSRGLLARLSDAGYDGPVTAETLAHCQSLAGLTAREIAARTAQMLRNVWPPSVPGLSG